MRSRPMAVTLRRAAAVSPESARTGAAAARRMAAPAPVAQHPVLRALPKGSGTVGTYVGTCYDMATYPCIYVYDAPGINPSSLWQLWSWNLYS